MTIRGKAGRPPPGKDLTATKRAASRQEAGTPTGLFVQLHKEYRFNVDICAVPHNAKMLPFVTPERNALVMHWRRLWLTGGDNPIHPVRAYCNPPYIDIPSWLAHALEPEIAVFLLPVRTDREWFRRWKPLAETHWFVGEKPHKRLQFEPPPGLKYSSNPDCNMLFCFGVGFTPGLERWRSGRTYELFKSLRSPYDQPDNHHHQCHFA